jgi:hypothetical protein
MPQLPKIARERLKVSTSAVAHPDPDVLTAFSERSLPDSERALVLEHLARCGDCREIVALALPAADEVQVPRVTTPGRSSWLTWPGLRWGVVAAGVVIVASFGVLQYRKRPAPMPVASQANAKNEVASYDSVQPATPPQTKAEEESSSQSKDAKQDETHATGGTRAAVALAKPSPNAHAMAVPAQRVDGPKVLDGLAAGSAGGAGNSAGFVRGPKMAMATPPPGMAQASEFRSNAGFPAKRISPPTAPQANAPVPSVSETVEVQAQAQAQLQTEAASAAPQSRDQIQQQELQNESGQQEGANQEVLKAKPSVDVQGALGGPTAAPANSNAGTLSQEGRNMRLPHQWSINSGGGLQRSVDMGKTWENVEVDESSAASYALTAETLARQSKVPKPERKKNQKEKEAATNPQFRAVVATGPEVWAGGTGGMLYHSVDGGEHWARIVLQAAGVVFTGDIISVEFSDSQHGRITTSTSQVWMTSDGGKSWQH